MNKHKVKSGWGLSSKPRDKTWGGPNRTTHEEQRKPTEKRPGTKEHYPPPPHISHNFHLPHLITNKLRSPSTLSSSLPYLFSTFYYLTLMKDINDIHEDPTYEVFEVYDQNAHNRAVEKFNEQQAETHLAPDIDVPSRRALRFPDREDDKWAKFRV
jgi:hypothetical protein